MTTIAILTAGRYSKTMPADLQRGLEESILQHMKAYGVEDCRVLTREEDYKRAYSNDLYEALDLLVIATSTYAEKPSTELIDKCLSALAKARGETA